MLEEKLDEQLQLSIEYERLRCRWKYIEMFESDSRKFEEIISQYEARMAGRSGTAVNIVGSGLRTKHWSAEDGKKRFTDIMIRLGRVRHSKSLNELPLIRFYAMF